MLRVIGNLGKPATLEMQEIRQECGMIRQIVEVLFFPLCVEPNPFLVTGS